MSGLRALTPLGPGLLHLLICFGLNVTVSLLADVFLNPLSMEGHQREHPQRTRRTSVSKDFIKSQGDNGK